MNKMTIEQFRSIKKRVHEFLEMESAEGYSAEEEERLLKDFYALMGELLNSDLSDIPFEEWKGMFLFSEGLLDLSKTHANIDFSLLEGIEYESINIDGCNVRGLWKIDYSEDMFDEKYISEHPELFPDKSLPDEIRSKFYEHKITFYDIYKYPALKKCVNPESFGKYGGGDSFKLVDHFGFENAMKLFEEFPELIITYTHSIHRSDSFAGLRFPKGKEIDHNASYEEARVFFFEVIFNSVREGYSVRYPDLALIPMDIRDRFPQEFVEDIDVPIDVKNCFYEGKLTVNQIRYYYEQLKDKDIDIGISNNYSALELKKVFGSIPEYLEKVPGELDNPMNVFFSDYKSEEEVAELKSIDPVELYERAIYQYLFGHNVYYNLEDIYSFSKYVPLSTMIENDEIISFIHKVGFERLVEFNNKYDGVLEANMYMGSDFHIGQSLLYAVILCLPVSIEELEINSFEDLENLMRVTIADMGRSGNYAEKLADQCRRLHKLCPDVFIDGTLLDELLIDIPPSEKRSISRMVQNAMNGDWRDLTDLLIEYPKLKELFVDVRFNFGDSKVETLYKALGTRGLLNAIVTFKGVMKVIAQMDLDKIESLISELSKGGNVEQVINDFVYGVMGDYRIFDVRDMPESFRSQHPELYLPEDAPRDLVNEFYGNMMYASYFLLKPTSLARHPEWIPYLEKVDIARSLYPVFFKLTNSTSSRYVNNLPKINAYEFLGRYLSNREILELVKDYGVALEGRDLILRTDKVEEHGVKNEMFYAIREGMIDRTIPYNEGTFPQDFMEANSDLYLTGEVPENVKLDFYKRNIRPSLFKNHPELVKFFLDKKLDSCVYGNYIDFVRAAMKFGYSNQVILDMFVKYGIYLNNASIFFQGKDGDVKALEDAIKRYLISNIERYPYGEDLYPLIGEDVPKAFLDPNAPQELKDCFYDDNQEPINFYTLKQHRDWIPFLEDKMVALAMSKKNGMDINLLKAYFMKRGIKEGLLIGIKSPAAVTTMIVRNKIDLFFKWYDRLHFIPHPSVMLDFPEEEIDKFAAHGKLWSNLMRLEGQNASDETITAMMRAAYAFGVFDGDIEGFTELMHLYTDLPKSLSYEDIIKLIKGFEIGILSLGDNQEVLPEVVEEVLNSSKFKEIKELLNKLYRKNNDGSYSLNVEQQKVKEDALKFRAMLDKAGVNGLLTPTRSHNIFGGFAYKCDPEFREFMMRHMDEILANPDYMTLASKMQAKWKAFKTVNSNQVLTLELFKNFVLENVYDNVEVGNELLAKEVAIGGYTQEQYEIVQEIYSYGKERVVSSIPRVTGEYRGHSFEMLRLDDVLPACIGHQSDCCQEIGNAAETCMEHSIVSEHGRVFVIRDEKGNIEAQSWVWRNKNVLCFDNIEVPHKAFIRAEMAGITREQYADQILQVYQQAAEAIIAADKRMYQSLLEAGKITQEQYDNLVIRRVTAGGGYNDVYDSLKRNTEEVQDELTMPLPFKQPVELGGLYTHDSQVSQFILAGDKEIPKSQEVTIAPYVDEFKIYDKDNITEKVILMINRMELSSKNVTYGRTFIYDKENIMNEIADNYNLIPETTRIIMNANFAIIYCIKDGVIVIGDIIQNTRVNENKNARDISDVVQYQTKLALQQIRGDMEFNTEMLDEREREMFNKAMGMEERSFAHGN